MEVVLGANFSLSSCNANFHDREILITPCSQTQGLKLSCVRSEITCPLAVCFFVFCLFLGFYSFNMYTNRLQLLHA